MSKHNLPRKRIRCHEFNEKSRELWIFVLFQQSILTKFSVTFWGFYYTRKQMVGQKYRQNITYLAKEFVATKSTEPRNPAHFLRATHVCWSFLFCKPLDLLLIPKTLNGYYENIDHNRKEIPNKSFPCFRYFVFEILLVNRRIKFFCGEQSRLETRELVFRTFPL